MSSQEKLPTKFQAKFVLVRHAQTRSNREFIKKLHGTGIDAAVDELDEKRGNNWNNLTQNGVGQAHRAGQRVLDEIKRYAKVCHVEPKDVHVQAYVSPFERTTETWGHMRETLKKTHSSDVGNFCLRYEFLFTEYDKDCDTTDTVRERMVKLKSWVHNTVHSVEGPTLIIVVSHAALLNSFVNVLHGNNDVQFSKGMTQSNPFYGFANGAIKVQTVVCEDGSDEIELLNHVGRYDHKSWEFMIAPNIFPPKSVLGRELVVHMVKWFSAGLVLGMAIQWF